MTELRNLFGNHVISRNGDIPWPARSPDLTACDLFLWGYLKSKVFANKPRNIQELKTAIREEIANITVEMLQRVMRNFKEQLQECMHVGGGHLKDVIFKK